MENAKIIAIGDNVCDKYLSRGFMYPGGQCINICAYATINGAEAAYLGKFGSDAVAEYNQKILTILGIDYSHSRHFEGENGYACVTLLNNDRVFIGSNHGGVAKEHSFSFNTDDFEYIKGYDLIYTNLNAYIEQDLPVLKATNRPIAYDFSNRWTDEYLKQVCPHITIASLSCAHLNKEEREYEMQKTQALGVPIVLGTMGENGSCVLYQEKFYYANAVHAEKVIDTMGAGDSYFATFIVSLIKSSENGHLFSRLDDEMGQRLHIAMRAGADFAARVCCMEGAFGYGTPIVD